MADLHLDITAVQLSLLQRSIPKVDPSAYREGDHPPSHPYWFTNTDGPGNAVIVGYCAGSDSEEHTFWAVRQCSCCPAVEQVIYFTPDGEVMGSTPYWPGFIEAGVMWRILHNAWEQEALRLMQRDGCL